MKSAAVYIMANGRNGTLYAGVSSNLVQRVYQHRNQIVKGFASRYGSKRLVYFEVFDAMTEAIAREKQIKGGSRMEKVALIEGHNPDWRDLYEDTV